VLNLRILNENSSWVLVDKPAGFHTHPPEDKQIRVNPRRDALAILERQLGCSLAPAHRLDRAASGLLLYGKTEEARSALQGQLAQRAVKKTYYVLARGGLHSRLEMREPLEAASGVMQEAVTIAEPCFTFKLPIPHPRGGGDRRFTALAVQLETGRFHQIRRHFAGAGFPLLGDTRHGDRKLNREFAALTGCDELFLRCMTMEFECPESGEKISSRARWSKQWHRLFDQAGICALAQ
jgi:tRNA pseudouridine65 synthase